MGICSSNQLQYVEYKNTVEFIPPIQSGKVVKVYDGDTITIASKMPYRGSPIYRFHVRIAGINTPEMKGNGEAEKIFAIKSRNALYSLIYGKMVILSNTSIEKYGRILADVWIGTINVGEWLLENGYAVKYNGGTKHKWQT